MSLGLRGCSYKMSCSFYYLSSHSRDVKRKQMLIITCRNYSLRVCPLFKCIKLMPAHITFPHLTSVSPSVSGTFGELSGTTRCISSVQINCKVHQVQNATSENFTCKILDQTNEELMELDQLTDEFKIMRMMER